MDEVRATTAWVASRSSHVSVDSSGIERVVDTIKDSIPKVDWDFEGIHYFDNGPLTVQYLFVLDALNFCFWPDKDLSYDHLASGLKAALQNDKSVFDADRLQKYTGPELRKLLKWPRPLPLEDERVRLLHEVGLELERNFEGKASNLVDSCGKSAVKLVTLVTRHFPGFRDHSVYKGHQVFLYKRAQIFAADLLGAFKGKGYGEFNDKGAITIFADYIVPAVLRQLGVLRYSSALAGTIEAEGEIDSGSEEEVELRACSVYAVEKMRELMWKKFGKQVLSADLDLWLCFLLTHIFYKFIPTHLIWTEASERERKSAELLQVYISNCPTKKKVERSIDGQITEIVYKGNHDHLKPQNTRRSSSSASSQPIQHSNENPDQSFASNGQIDSVATPENSSTCIGCIRPEPPKRRCFGAVKKNAKTKRERRGRGEGRREEGGGRREREEGNGSSVSAVSRAILVAKTATTVRSAACRRSTSSQQQLHRTSSTSPPPPPPPPIFMALQSVALPPPPPSSPLSSPSFLPPPYSPQNDAFGRQKGLQRHDTICRPHNHTQTNH
ncbi:Queuosine salvage protein [Camellia lanceoleosa]|uniref:Queuosine salvage protein n=1 Tax=Camellia lanceoleosa TaxID=1840588 RepID=A0ACC0I737_9ERIC|nr:Queuosine salvage protein [Camellia lanceoleosa]